MKVWGGDTGAGEGGRGYGCWGGCDWQGIRVLGRIPVEGAGVMGRGYECWGRWKGVTGAGGGCDG